MTTIGTGLSVPKTHLCRCPVCGKPTRLPRSRYADSIIPSHKAAGGRKVNKEE